VSGGLANLSALSEQLDAKVAHAAKEQGWLTPSAAGEQLAAAKQARAKDAARRKAEAATRAAAASVDEDPTVAARKLAQAARREAKAQAEAEAEAEAEARAAQQARARKAAAALAARAARSTQAAADGGVGRALALGGVLARWANGFLGDAVVLRPAEDLRSGVVLYKLCEKLRGAPLSDYGRLVVPPQGQAFVKSISSLSNFYAAFRFLRERFGWPEDDEEYCSSDAIGRVGDGDLGAAVALLWLLAVHFTADALGVQNADRAGGAGSASSEAAGGAPAAVAYASVAASLEARKRASRRVLVAWARKSTQSFQHLAVRGLGRPSLGDGRALLALVAAHAPAQCPYAPAVGDDDDDDGDGDGAAAEANAGLLLAPGTEANVAAALGAAQSLFGCGPLWDAEDDTADVLAECASEALFLTVAGFKLRFPATRFGDRGSETESDGDSSPASPRSSAAGDGDGALSEDDAAGGGAAAAQGCGAGCGASVVALVTVHRAEGLNVHSAVRPGRRAALAAAVRVGHPPKRRLGGGGGGRSPGGDGSAVGRWQTTGAVRSNPCPAWGYTAAVPLAAADLRREAAPGEDDPAGGAPTKCTLEVFVKVLAVDEASGDDVCLGTLALNLPLTCLMEGSSSGSSRGGGDGGRQLWPPVQAPVDRRFFALAASQAVRAGAVAGSDDEGEGEGGETGMRVLLSVSAVEPGAVAAWHLGAGAAVAAEEAALRKAAAKSEALAAENARLKLALAALRGGDTEDEAEGRREDEEFVERKEEEEKEEEEEEEVTCDSTDALGEETAALNLGGAFGGGSSDDDAGEDAGESTPDGCANVKALLTAASGRLGGKTKAQREAEEAVRAMAELLGAVGDDVEEGIEV
jgi:hypothetical protein